MRSMLYDDVTSRGKRQKVRKVTNGDATLLSISKKNIIYLSVCNTKEQSTNIYMSMYCIDMERNTKCHE